MTYEIAISALSDPTRRAIVERLRTGALPVGALAEALPVSRPAVSQHLKVLGDAGLVTHEVRGTRHYYALNAAGFADLRNYLDTLWTDALGAFAAHVRKREQDR